MDTVRTRWALAVLTFATALVVPACSHPADVDDVKIGSDVAVTTADGSTVHGKLVDRTASAVVVEQKATGRRDTIERAEIARVEEPAASPLAEIVKPEPKSHDVTVAAGTSVPLTLDIALGSESNHPEDPVSATVRSPVVVDGATVIPQGSTLRGTVTRAMPAGNVKGRAQLAFRFDELSIDHTNYKISTDAVSYQAQATKKQDATKIGGGAAIGSVVGAIAGGKKGAAIGAAVGGGAGTAMVLTTSGDEVHLAPGAEFTAALTNPVTISVPNE